MLSAFAATKLPVSSVDVPGVTTGSASGTWALGSLSACCSFLSSSNNSANASLLRWRSCSNRFLNFNWPVVSVGSWITSPWLTPKVLMSFCALVSSLGLSTNSSAWLNVRFFVTASALSPLAALVWSGWTSLNEASVNPLYSQIILPPTSIASAVGASPLHMTGALNFLVPSNVKVADIIVGSGSGGITSGGKTSVGGIVSGVVPKSSLVSSLHPVSASDTIVARNSLFLIIYSFSF